MTRRLKSIETLPEKALDDLQWLFDAIRSNRKTQKDMLAEFNTRLAALEIDPVSSSSLNRYCIAVRNGEITRPRAIGTPTAAQGWVFSAEFRARLTSSVGEEAARGFEAALASLITRKPEENGQ